MITIPFPNKRYAIRGIRPATDRKLKAETRTTHGDITKNTIQRQITGWNNNGFNIYWTPATLKPKSVKLTKNDILHTTAVWIDKDHGGALPDNFEPKPSVIIETSKDKYQYYWLLDKPCDDHQRVEALLTAMIHKTGADTSRSNINSIMRLPGTVNTKDDANGFECTMHHQDLTTVYCIEFLEEQFPPVSIDDTTGKLKTEYNYRQCHDNIITGEVIHDSRASISMHFANIGVPEYVTLEHIDSLLDLGYRLGNIEPSRFNERKGNNKQVVRSAYEKVRGEINAVDIKTVKSRYTKLPPLPPDSGLNTIVQDIMGNMFHPVYEMAVPLAMHLVGTFGSGPYHLDGVTGTKRRAICMASGSGKDVVSDYLHACIDSLDDSRAEKFIGIQSFTPRTVHAELMEFRCRSYVMSEAGLRGQSEAGDVKNMRAYQLQLLGSKHTRTLTITQTTADIRAGREANSTFQVNGAVVNIIAESTPETYAKMLAFTDADVTGMMAREELIFPEPNFDFNKSNRHGFREVSPEVLDILRPLAQNFLDHPLVGGVGNYQKMFTPVDTTAIDDILDDCHAWHCTQREEHKESSQAISTQYSRMFEKIKCTTLILALADGLPLQVKPHHVEWAKAYHEAIKDAVLNQMEGGVLGNPTEACVRVCEIAIMKYPGLARDKRLSDNNSTVRRIVKGSWFSDVLHPTNCTPFRELVALMYNKRDVARKAVIQELIDKGLITPMKDNKFQLSRVK